MLNLDANNGEARGKVAHIWRVQTVGRQSRPPQMLAQGETHCWKLTVLLLTGVHDGPQQRKLQKAATAHGLRVHPTLLAQKRPFSSCLGMHVHVAPSSEQALADGVHRLRHPAVEVLGPRLWPLQAYRPAVHYPLRHPRLAGRDVGAHACGAACGGASMCVRM